MRRRTSNSTNVSPDLQPQLEKRLAAYALAIGGVALTTLPAHAEVVFTKTNRSLTNGVAYLDLNNDGISDFGLANNSDPSSYGSTRYLLAIHGQNTSAAVVGHIGYRFGTAWPAPYGFSIGPNSPKSFIALTDQVAVAMARGSCFYGRCFVSGPWQRETDKYLGVRFNIKGQTHYGWARFSVKFNGYVKVTVTLTGYAYETQANTAILAGDKGPTEEAAELEATKPSVVRSPSLGLLSLGAIGLDTWRRH
jgi:hypothetical protein